MTSSQCDGIHTHIQSSSTIYVAQDHNGSQDNLFYWCGLASNTMCQEHTISTPYYAQMARNRSALGSVLVPGAFNRDNTVWSLYWERELVPHKPRWLRAYKAQSHYLNADQSSITKIFNEVSINVHMFSLEKLLFIWKINIILLQGLVIWNDSASVYSSNIAARCNCIDIHKVRET